MSETISAAALGGMVCTLVVAIGLPVAAFFLVWKRLGAKPLHALFGAAGFIVFALILEQTLHQAVLGALGERLTGNRWLYALYGGLAAGLFEETGRWLVMRYLMKKELSRENALMYGVGHGGVECVLLVGLTYVSNLVTSLLINAGGLDQLLSSVEEPLRTQVREQLSALWTTPAPLYYLAGLERICAFFLQLGFSYLVYRGVKERKAAWFLLAVAAHFVMDAMTVLLSGAVSALAVELALLAFTAVFFLAVLRLYRTETGEI